MAITSAIDGHYGDRNSAAENNRCNTQVDLRLA
jgi:hypothetical protein